jgi:hypothetical protein
MLTGTPQASANEPGDRKSNPSGQQRTTTIRHDNPTLLGRWV